MRTWIMGAVVTGCFSVLGASTALAGDAATVIFKSGQVVRIEDGFRQITEAMRSLNGKEKQHKIVELTIGGGAFLLDMSQVVITCRDSCSSITVVQQLAPRRGEATGDASR